MRCGARCGPGGGRAWGGAGGSGMHRGKARLKAFGCQGTRGAHVEHVGHVRDLGGVEAQRLVERVRALPSRKEGMRCGARCGPGGRREGVGREVAQAACTGKARLKAVGGQGTRGAHPEHGVHVSDLGRVEAQRLVEPRLLPSRWEGMRCGARCRPGGGRAWGGGGASGTHREGPTQGVRVRARAERTWNMASMFVTLEVSKLSGWLNAIATCRVEGRGMRCGARCGPGGGRA